MVKDRECDSKERKFPSGQTKSPLPNCARAEASWYIHSTRAIAQLSGSRTVVAETTPTDRLS